MHLHAHIYPFGRPTFWEKHFVLKPATTITLFVISLLWIPVAIVVIVYLIASSMQQSTPALVGSEWFPPAFFGTLIASFTAYQLLQEAHKRIHEIIDGDHRERYVVGTDFSFQLYFERLGMRNDFADNPEVLNALFGDKYVIQADEILRKADATTSDGVVMIWRQQRVVLNAAQALYVKNPMTTANKFEALAAERELIDQHVREITNAALQTQTKEVAALTAFADRLAQGAVPS